MAGSFFAFFAVLFLCASFVLGALNVTRLMEIYTNACGTKRMCSEWSEFKKMENYPITSRCPPCSCEEDCFRLMNCCPDKFFLERKLTRMHLPFYEMPGEPITAVMFQRYAVIDYCPNYVDKTMNSLCQKPPKGLKNRIFVTSLVSNYTYYNFHCALCHWEEETDLVQWEITIYNFDYAVNFVESVEELLQIIRYFKNSFILFYPQNSLKDIVAQFTSNETTYSEGCFDDEDLALACDSSYFHEYRLFKNIFCFMCKTQRLELSKNSISSCLSQDNDARKLCMTSPQSDLTYPYRNYHCFSCNVPAPFVSGISPNDQNKDGTRYTFLDMSTLIREDSFEVLTFSHNVFNDFLLLQKIYNTSRITKSNMPPDNKDFSYLLKKMAAVYPHRICNHSVLPSVVQNLSRIECDCSLSCLFTDSCACCIDTALTHSVECISYTRAAFSEYYKEKDIKIQVVRACYKEMGENIGTQEDENITYLCENDDLNEFDIPVMSRNITYKNVFCFLCNTNFKIENSSLITEPYNILNIRIHCKQQLIFNFFASFSQVLIEALAKKCDIVYDINRLVICASDKKLDQFISTCNVSIRKIDIDKAELWACEKTSHQVFPSFGDFKNEFCYLCNSQVTSLVEANACNVSSVHLEAYKNACVSLPDVSYHPVVHPHRNIFCSLCTKEASNLSLPSKQSCAPILGTKLQSINSILRYLFVPTLTLNADIFNTVPQSVEYGCYPGRVMRDGVCKPVIQFPVRIKYSLHVLCSLRVSALTNDTSYVLSKVRWSVRRNLVNSYIKSDIELKAFYFLPELPINIGHRDGLIFYELEVSLSYTLLYITRFNRDVVERELINTPQNIRINYSINGSAKISFSFESFRFSNISKTLSSHNTIESDYNSYKNYYQDALLIRPGVDIIVSELLVCFHQFFEQTEVNIDFDNYRVVVKKTKEAFYIGDFIIDYKNRFRVCAKLPPPSSLSSSLVESLNTLTTVLNIISSLFLVLLFVIYLLIPELRTVPGVNVMSSTFSLFCMQLTYTVSNVMRKDSLPCKITGVLLHYFWLCLCCCFFICCFHMIKSFRSQTVIQTTHSHKQFFRYLMFSYGFPFIVVSSNALISRYVTGNIGYGTTICFVEGLIQNITTFIIPIILTCLGNILLFFLTIISINLDKNIQKSKKNKSELVIFFKLFCLTGSVWILQVIDSFLQLSFFSFVAAILTSSQGLFIFLSFATSPRIFKYLKKMMSRPMTH